MVFYGRFAAGCLRHFIHWHDHLVSGVVVNGYKVAEELVLISLVS